jgi:hypothetical protein
MFNLTLEKVKEDIEFTMSKLKKIMFIKSKNNQENEEKNKELDEKINQLKNQVDKLKKSNP